MPPRLYRGQELITMTRSYLDDALALSPAEESLRTEYSNWLPDALVDCHAHANGASAVQELTSDTMSRVHSTFPTYGIEDSLRVRDVLYPGKGVLTLRFANPYRGVDHREANAYLLKQSPSRDKVALYGLPDDPSYTIDQMLGGEYAALKMYPYYYEPPAETIAKYYPAEVLSVAESIGLPIILHLPCALSRCMEQLSELVSSFPRLTIVLAHLGREQDATSASLSAYDALKLWRRVFADLSMVSSPELVRQALEVLGPERLLFGTDEPFNLLRYVSYQHPQMGVRYASQHSYHWLDDREQQQYRHLAHGAVHVHWRVLQATRYAVETVSRNGVEHSKGLIFCENSQRVFGAFSLPQVSRV